MSLKENITQIEDDFFAFKSGFEKKYSVIVMVFMGIFALAVLYLNRFQPIFFYNIRVRLTIFISVLILSAVHFALRFTYFTSNAKYVNYLTEIIKINYDPVKDTEIETIISTSKSKIFKKSFTLAFKKYISNSK